MAAAVAENLELAESLVNETKRLGGLAPVDVARFWADQEVASKDPFGASIPQVPLGAVLNGECVFDELGVPEDRWRYNNDEAWRLSLNKAYNDKAEKIVGRRLLCEDKQDATRCYPTTKGLADLFECKNIWHDQSWWLQQSAHNEDELSSLLDRVEKRLENLKEFMLPENWGAEKARLAALGVEPPSHRGQRGPITFATSVFGAEDFILLVLDNPDLAGRFRDLILRGLLGIAKVLDDEAGRTPETWGHYFCFYDDNCCLMTPDMYEFFGYPILKGVFDTFCPKPEHWRYQHSDSPMGHLLPILGKLKLKTVNFGPTLLVSEIRQHLPGAVIDGQLAPFTYSRNEEVNIVCEFLRDFAQAKEKRGLNFSTAGSINNGTRLASMRLLMAAIQRYGRYE